MKKTTLFIMVVIAALVSSCVTPPAQHTFPNAKTYNKDFDTVWANLIHFFTTNNIQIKTIEKVSGVIYAERTFTPGMSYTPDADCGQSGLWQPIVTSAQFNVFVTKDPTGAGTQVTVNTVYQQRLQFEDNTRTITCTSTGGLEQQILASL